ncbi:MAG: 3-dehydroquinate synthase [Lachnospiraceae bacterium]|nr:3-dehydroquinate synthase [Lachnospiraceae bacterium]
MSSVLNVSVNKKPAYDIVIERDFDKLAGEIEKLGLTERKFMIVTDDIVSPIYADKVKTALGVDEAGIFVHAFKAGEKSKNMDTVIDILKDMTDKKFNRKDVVIALGGGVVGDVAGFAAAIYMRGIAVIQIPTSLLAQVDSSVGGKTGVDLDEYKNMVGAFKMPALVYINTSVLSTLDARQYYAGMAEVMKYGLIMDGAFYEWLLGKMYEIHDKDADTLEEMIEHCCACKQRIVERDPLEQGDRALLNFGHTIGHAIEKYKGFSLLHGECVALGSVAAAYISWKKDRLSMDEYYEIRDMFVPFNLPISVDDVDPEEIIKLTRSDKKAESDGIKFILLKKVGKAVIDKSVTEKEMFEALNEIIFTEDGE